MKSLKLLNLKPLDHQKGFTLIEVLITSFVFSIIILAVGGLFVQVIGNERRAFAAQKIQDNGLYIMELLAREIRVSQITDQDSTNCSRTTLSVVHPVNGTVTYSANNGGLQRTANGTVTDLSTSDINFSRLNFCVMGSSPTDNEQVRVAILASIQNRIGKEILTFNLETTVSSRDVELELTQ